MASKTAYNIGDVVRLKAELANADGQLVDPQSITFRLKDPTGNTCIVEHNEDATGVFYADATCSVAGQHRWRVETTGTYKAAEEGSFYVRRSAF